MLGSGIAGRARRPLKRMWSSRLAVPLRPASAGPVRYWQDQVRLAVKAAIAAVGAWALARYVRQLADLRTARPQETLAAARDCLRLLEHQAARRPDYSDAKSARHLVRLTGGILAEIAEHHSARRGQPLAAAGD